MRRPGFALIAVFWIVMVVGLFAAISAKPGRRIGGLPKVSFKTLSRLPVDHRQQPLHPRP